MGEIIFASPRGLPQVYPVGSPVAGPLEAFGIDEGLQQIERMPIDLLPVPGDPPCHLSQQMGCEVGNRDPGQQEASAVVGYEVDVFLANPGRPSDEAVPASDVARGR